MNFSLTRLFAQKGAKDDRIHPCCDSALCSVLQTDPAALGVKLFSAHHIHTAPADADDCAAVLLFALDLNLGFRFLPNKNGRSIQLC